MVVKDPKRSCREDNLICLDGTERCPHLIGSVVGEYRCAIHHYRWFKTTPCGRHGQIERGNSDCRMGAYLLKKLHESNKIF